MLCWSHIPHCAKSHALAQLSLEEHNVAQQAICFNYGQSTFLFLLHQTLTKLHQVYWTERLKPTLKYNNTYIEEIAQPAVDGFIHCSYIIFVLT